MPEPSVADACPTCSRSPLVRVLWGHSYLTARDKKDIAAGEALLGLGHRHFTRVLPRLIIGERIIAESSLPTRVCLHCSPGWAEVHRLAHAEWEACVAAIAVVGAEDIERAAALSHEHDQLEAANLGVFERLLQGLLVGV
jgi:hypothetical protein